MSRCLFHDGGICEEPCVNTPKYSVGSTEEGRFDNVLCKCKVIMQNGKMSDWTVEEILWNIKIKVITNECVCLITNGQDQIQSIFF